MELKLLRWDLVRVVEMRVRMELKLLRWDLVRELLR